MQEIRSPNLPVVTGMCDPNKSRARHHRKNMKQLKNGQFSVSEKLVPIRNWCPRKDKVSQKKKVFITKPLN